MSSLFMALASLIAVPATDGHPTVIRVGIADLNAATSAGRRAVDRRVRQAVRQICPDRDISLAVRRSAQVCRHAIVVTRPAHR